MYKGPHLADYCTRCSTSAAMAVNIVDYTCICMYIIILYYYIATICVISDS